MLSPFLLEGSCFLCSCILNYGTIFDIEDAKEAIARSYLYHHNMTICVNTVDRNLKIELVLFVQFKFL